VTTRRKIPTNIQTRVRERSAGLCEYCHAVEAWQYVRFTVDHITPVARGGTNALANLALACFHCNRRKGDKQVAEDPETREQARLFDPRREIWPDHFIWSSDTLYLIGLTPAGRATIGMLEINRPWALNIRAADRAVGRHPPDDDPVALVTR